MDTTETSQTSRKHRNIDINNSSTSLSSITPRKLVIDPLDLLGYRVRNVTIPTTLSTNRAREARAIRQRCMKNSQERSITCLNSSKDENLEYSLLINDSLSNISEADSVSQKQYLQAIKKAHAEEISKIMEDIRKVKLILGCRERQIKDEEDNLRNKLESKKIALESKKQKFNSLAAEVHCKNQKLFRIQDKIKKLKNEISSNMNTYVENTVSMADAEAEIELKLHQLQDDTNKQNEVFN